MSRPRDPLLAGRTERIDTRVLPETRASLQTAATANRVSLSREIEARLVESLEVDALSEIAAGKSLRSEKGGAKMPPSPANDDPIAFLRSAIFPDDGEDRDMAALGHDLASRLRIIRVWCAFKAMAGEHEMNYPPLPGGWDEVHTTLCEITEWIEGLELAED